MTKIDEEILEDHTQRVFKLRRHGVSAFMELLGNLSANNKLGYSF